MTTRNVVRLAAAVIAAVSARLFCGVWGQLAVAMAMVALAGAPSGGQRHVA